METILQYRKINKSELSLVPEFIISLAKSQGKEIVFDEINNRYLIAQIDEKDFTGS